MTARIVNCPDCDGHGAWVEFIGTPGEPYERICESCGGEGQWEEEVDQLTEVHGDPFLNKRRKAA